MGWMRRVVDWSGEGDVAAGWRLLTERIGTW